ncbi:LigA protein [Kutzneria sp. 744]|nr:LigA protein [Kutzneria sp. 744]
MYLGPAVPRWQPRTIADIRTVLADGLLAERHWLDAKREISTGSGKKDAKKELARDVASFANDGGVLIIGIDEDKTTGTFTLASQSLDGLAETVEQIVGHHCDPPVFVQCHRIVDPNDPIGPNRGVMIVEVPPSPLAPHMVDGKYFGRADTLKRVLPDADVERLHVIRRARQVTAEELIDREIDRDPAPADERDGVRLYVVARPMSSPPELLTEHFVTGALTTVIHAARATGEDDRWPRGGYVDPRARGIGWPSRNLRGRRQAGKSHGDSDLEVHDDGTITFFADTLSGSMNPSHRQQHFVRLEAVLGLVRSVVQFAGEIGARFGYAGQWQLAVGVTGLRGLPAAIVTRRHDFVDFTELATFSELRYTAGTTAVTGELTTAAAAVTRRLMMRFARAFDLLNRVETDDYLGRPRQQAQEERDA